MSAERGAAAHAAEREPETFDELADEAWHHLDSATSLLAECLGAADALDGMQAVVGRDNEDHGRALWFIAAGLRRLLEKSAEDVSFAVRDISAARKSAARERAGAAVAEIASRIASRDEAPEDDELEAEEPHAMAADGVARCGTSDAPMPLWRQTKRKGRA